MKNVLIVAVTGGIACGKSEVGRILERSGWKIWDADDCAHRLLEPGQAVYDAVLRRFGPGILGTNGAIDRSVLGRIVFADGGARADLNAIVHPAVHSERRRWVAERRNAGEPAAVIVPLLFEVGDTEGWDAIVCVAASPDRVRHRLADRGLDETGADRRLRAQWPLEEKISRATHVIRNDGSLADLEEKTLRTVESIRSGKGTNHG